MSLHKTFPVFILLCVSTFTAPCRAQTDDAGLARIFKFVEVMPSFSGNLSEFMFGNLVYPKSSIAHQDTGRVIIEFTVQTSGMVENAHVLRSSGHDSLDAEALRVVKIWEKFRYWTPGKQKGKEVPVFFTIPVTFKLD
jgi:protein TonB